MSSTNEIRNKRPTSPHLTIYKLQISSVMSITHRLTGISLFCGFAILAWWMIICIFSKFDESIVSLIDCSLVKIALYALIAAFFYHLCNGIRHLFWDMGSGYSLPAMHKSGWMVVVATTILTIIFWFITN